VLKELGLSGKDCKNDDDALIANLLGGKDDIDYENMDDD